MQHTVHIAHHRVAQLEALAQSRRASCPMHARDLHPNGQRHATRPPIWLPATLLGFESSLLPSSTLEMFSYHDCNRPYHDTGNTTKSIGHDIEYLEAPTEQRLHKLYDNPD